MEYTFLLGSLENILGKSGKRARDNYAFHCPFCNHRKPKLEINLLTDDEGKNYWECWVCKARGRTIHSLLKQLGTPKPEAQEVLKYVKKGPKYEYSTENTVELPEDFQPLYSASITSVTANKIRKYLNRRGVSEKDLIKYNIGYTNKGEYTGRIIIPSYSDSNKLNYFTGRTYENSFFKYKNPVASKDIVFFENLINWNQPIILCEGVFDAIAIRRNAVPLLGKSLSPSLLKKIITSKSQDIYIALDLDAQKEALAIAENLLSLGKRVFFIQLNQKDPSEIGFEAFTRLLQQAKELDLTGLMTYKINQL